MSLTSNSRSAGVNELTTARNPTADGFLRKFSGACFFFLSPRRRSGERTEERGILTQRPSSPRPSPPSDGGEGVSSIAAVPRRVNPWLNPFLPAPQPIRHDGEQNNNTLDGLFPVRLDVQMRESRVYEREQQ